MKRIFLLVCLTPLFKLHASDTAKLKTINKITGIYKCGLETLYFESKMSTFYLKRSVPKFQDVAVPLCYDTIAKGSFKVFNDKVVILMNDKKFHKVDYGFTQEKVFSEDTIYVKIRLPEDDAFFAGRFRYLFSFGCITIKSDSAFIKIPSKKIKCEGGALGLLIQDLYPQSGIEEEKCYQRIYFRIFDLLRVNSGSNYFTITLNNFAECFVERMDVENDFIYFDGKNSIFWRGKEYKRSKPQNDARLSLNH